VIRSLDREHDVATMVTRARGHGEQLARQALDEGYTTLVSLGGDGTVNEIAGALEDTGALLCPVPLGGTNVFARAMGWPAAPEAAVSLLGEALRRRDALTRSIRLWEIRADGDRRLMCLNAGMGIDGEVVAEVERRPIAKRTLGQGAFAVGAALAVEHTARRGGVLTVISDEAEAIRAASVSMALGGPYAYLGPTPLDLIPGANFDGRLHWLGLSQGRRMDVARVATGAFASGRQRNTAGVVNGAAERSLTIRADAPIAVQADGEALGEHVEIRCAPAGSLRVLSPRLANGAQESSRKTR
jgi:diacylglycerol kinase family enzyme